MPRYAILAIGAFDYIYSKTGNMLIRYRPDEVVVVNDHNHFIGMVADKHVPCVASFSDAKDFSPTHLVIGSAPPGGVLDDANRKEIREAVQNGCHIINGMHVFLNDDPELSAQANKNNAVLTDLRKPPSPPNFPKGTWKNRTFPVLQVVGSDCDTGKMTTAWEITESLKKRNRKVEFIGTGQTGILLSGKGISIDAVVSDFMAGEIEYCLDQLPKNTELAVVEGQGALNNMDYSGVTLGLLHGSMPDFMVFTHEPGRTLDVSDHPIPDLKELMNMHMDLLNPFKESRFLGMNFLTLKMDDELAVQTCSTAHEQYNIPVTDLVRFGGEELIYSIETAIDAWR